MSRFRCELVVGDRAITVRDLGRTRRGSAASPSWKRARGVVLALGHSEIELAFGDDFAELPLAQRESFGGLVGRSRAMRALFAQLERAAESDSTVLLAGETGTGKELAARGIHAASSRATEPFVVVDCGGIPLSLFDAELFGHERGAFTGADRVRPGTFELADGARCSSTRSASCRPSCNRYRAQRREVQYRGGAIPVDVRIIAATNRNLRVEVNAGRFRPIRYRLVLEVTCRRCAIVSTISPAGRSVRARNGLRPPGSRAARRRATADLALCVTR